MCSSTYGPPGNGALALALLRPALCARSRGSSSRCLTAGAREPALHRVRREAGRTRPSPRFSTAGNHFGSSAICARSTSVSYSPLMSGVTASKRVKPTSASTSRRRWSWMTASMPSLSARAPPGRVGQPARVEVRIDRHVVAEALGRGEQRVELDLLDGPLGRRARSWPRGSPRAPRRRRRRASFAATFGFFLQQRRAPPALSTICRSSQSSRHGRLDRRVRGRAATARSPPAGSRRSTPCGSAGGSAACSPRSRSCRATAARRGRCRAGSARARWPRRGRATSRTRSARRGRPGRRSSRARRARAAAGSRRSAPCTKRCQSRSSTCPRGQARTKRVATTCRPSKRPFSSSALRWTSRRERSRSSPPLSSCTTNHSGKAPGADAPRRLARDRSNPAAARRAAAPATPS